MTILDSIFADSGTRWSPWTMPQLNQFQHDWASANTSATFPCCSLIARSMRRNLWEPQWQRMKFNSWRAETKSISRRSASCSNVCQMKLSSSSKQCISSVCTTQDQGVKQELVSWDSLKKQSMRSPISIQSSIIGGWKSNFGSSSSFSSTASVSINSFLASWKWSLTSKTELLMNKRHWQLDLFIIDYFSIFGF